MGPPDADGQGDDDLDPARIDDPRTHADDALEAFVDTVDDAGDDLIERGRALSDGADALTTAFAEAALAGLEDGVWQTHCATVARSVNELTKTNLLNETERKIRDLSASASPGPNTWAFLNNALVEIQAVRSTDHHQSTLYRWVFDGDGGDFSIETGEGTGANHYVWTDLQTAIFDAAGVWTTDPPDAIRSNWRQTIGPFIGDHARDVPTTGPRTRAVEAIQNHIRRSTAYPTIEDMVDHVGVRIDGDPTADGDGDEPTEIWVRTTEIVKICDDEAISERGLQNELTARGHTVDRIAGVSESTFVHGEKATYWVLSASTADPAHYEPDPESPIERFDRLEREESERSRGTAPGDDEAGDDDEEGPTGVIGSTSASPSTDDRDRGRDAGGEGR